MAIKALRYWTYMLTSVLVSFTAALGRTEGINDLGGLVDPESSAPLCPDPSLIDPCTCDVDWDDQMDMHCSKVESDDLLWTIFHQSFPDNKFSGLWINHNEGLTILKEGIFGNVTFEKIYITYTNIREVEPGALLGSKLTARKITIEENYLLPSFPFDDIPLFESLEYLSLTFNNITQVPPLKSSTLDKLYLQGNYIRNLEPRTFDLLTNLTGLCCHHMHLDQVLPGTFTNIPKLNYLDLFNNHLTLLPEGAVTLHGEDSQVNVNDNRLSNVSAGAITGEIGSIGIYRTDLTELTEEVWRPIMEKMTGTFYAEGNPLLCGCEIAWLILSPHFMEKLDGTETCFDGTLLTNLDPAVYEEFC